MQEDDLYWINRWGEEYFRVNAQGNVTVRPNKEGPEGDLFHLVQSLVEKGIEAPILIRFNGIIENRVKVLTDAFKDAIQEYSYRASHRIAFPIKVNPQRHVVETVQSVGQEYLIGLEVGSKPELLAALTLEHNPEALLLCNGYKDAEYISFALMAIKLGRRALIIVEQSYELNLVLQVAQQLGVEAEIGFRMKLSHKGTGRWNSSGGEQSKFGLFAHEIVACLAQLEAAGKSHWLKLLHFHIGSQITTIESIKKALKEGARMYTELAKKYSSLCFFDVGGGLAVDYDGSKSAADSSMNYTVQEYARDVIFAIGEACLEADVNDPIVITESGRFIVTHHCVLVTEVIDVTTTPTYTQPLEAPESDNEMLETLRSLNDELTIKNCRETFHDVTDIKERVLEEFVYGRISLIERAYAEKLCWILLSRIRKLYQELEDPPEEISALDQVLKETYFCNFSVFQSLPDSWAIDQLFPVMPIHRLHEKANHKGVLADLSCDSDGKIDRFIGKPGTNNFLQLHEYNGGPYYVGVFLVGAYQEILGGLHNLFGDTNVVHAELDETGKWIHSKLVEGDSIEEVLHYVQYNTENLMNQLHQQLERSIKAERMTPAESAQVKKKFKQALESYTYLVV
ncbi:MAG: biosynthetic arginine decarboxylase [Chlamydiales bacterium]|nr:biosynthetic arginine decarboxylase [Chlamydiales bacterium]